MSKSDDRSKRLQSEWKKAEEDTKRAKKCERHVFNKVKFSTLYRCIKCDMLVLKLAADWYELGIRHGQNLRRKGTKR